MKRRPSWDEIPLWLKLSIGSYLITIFLSGIFEWRIDDLDLGSSVGAALLFLLWFGLGAICGSFKGPDDEKDERKVLLYVGLVAFFLPVVLFVFIAIGGTLGWIASAASLVICLYLGYLQRRA